MDCVNGLKEFCKTPAEIIPSLSFNSVVIRTLKFDLNLLICVLVCLVRHLLLLVKKCVLLTATQVRMKALYI